MNRKTLMLLIIEFFLLGELRSMHEEVVTHEWLEQVENLIQLSIQNTKKLISQRLMKLKELCRRDYLKISQLLASNGCQINLETEKIGSVSTYSGYPGIFVATLLKDEDFSQIIMQDVAFFCRAFEEYSKLYHVAPNADSALSPEVLRARENRKSIFWRCQAYLDLALCLKLLIEKLCSGDGLFLDIF